jgi:hypothetical protein
MLTVNGLGSVYAAKQARKHRDILENSCASIDARTLRLGYLPCRQRLLLLARPTDSARSLCKQGHTLTSGVIQWETPHALSPCF